MKRRKVKKSKRLNRRPASLRPPVPSPLSSKARALLRWFCNMDHKHDDPYAPLKAPWEPGVNVRRFVSPTGGPVYQLRPGAMLPGRVYMQLQDWALRKASIQAARPCMN